MQATTTAWKAAEQISQRIDPLRSMGSLTVHEGWNGGVPEAALPYAAENIYKPPGGENPVAELDEKVALAEQLRSPGGQQALEEAIEYLERV